MRLPSPRELMTFVRERIPTTPPKLARAQWIWIGAGAVLALLLVWLAWPRAQAVDVAVIDRGPVRTEVVDEGRTRIHDVFVISTPVSGRLQRVELEPGDAVEPGQIVATISPADPALLDARVAAEANAAVNAAQAALDAAQAQYRLSQNDRERVAALHARDFASEAALDAADAASSAARANVNARRADLVRARAAASSSSSRAWRATPVVSPAAGRVLRVLQESETIALAGSPLIEIGDPAHIEIVAEFLSQDAVRMQAGAAAQIENWGGDAPIAARVFRIEPYARTKISALGVEEQRVNVILHLQAPELGPPLGHGFRVDARVVIAEQADALRVPTDALVRDGRDWAVFVLEGGRARLTPIGVGVGGEEYRAVTQGLEPGQRVVLFPGDSLADGARIRAGR
jgi:HlyD family secretion protein